MVTTTLPAPHATPHPLLETLGSPPGLLADIGGTLTPHADHLQHSGWILHMTSMDQSLIRHAARNGVRTAMRAPATDLPFPDSRYNGAALTLPDTTQAVRALTELARVCRPGAAVAISITTPGDTETLAEAVYRSGLTRVALHRADGEPLVVTATTAHG